MTKAYLPRMTDDVIERRRLFERRIEEIVLSSGLRKEHVWTRSPPVEKVSNSSVIRALTISSRISLGNLDWTMQSRCHRFEMGKMLGL